MISKVDLINAVAEEIGITKKSSSEAVNAILKVITKALADGEKVSIAGLGIFSTKKCPERMCHNPKDPQKQVVCPACTKVVFKGAKALKDRLNAE